MTLAAGAFVLLDAIVLALSEPAPLPGELGSLGGQSQDAETALYLIAFGLLIPAALIAGPRLADAIAAGPNGDALPFLAAALGGGLIAALLGAKGWDLANGGGAAGAILVAAAIWWSAAGLIIARSARPREWSVLRRLSARESAAWWVTGALAVAMLLSFTTLASIDPLVVAAAAVLAGAGYLARDRLSAPSVGRSAGALLDAAVVVALLTLILDLVIFQTQAEGADPATAFRTGVIQFHHNFLLGPANQVLAGDAVLVDTASQYGVGTIYLLAGWFTVAPIGYGTSGFLDGLLTGLYFAGGYALLRLGGVSRGLAAGAMAVAVVALAWNRTYAVGGLPQSGPLRFGLPLALILVTVAGARRRRAPLSFEIAGLGIVGLSSIWALEAFAYTFAVFLAMLAFRAWLCPPGGRASWAAARIGGALAACAVFHAVLALATLAADGELPDWGLYLAFLDAFLGDLGDITYDVPSWSPSLAVAAGLAASAAAIVLIGLRHRSFAESERVSLLALTGATVYGIALFSYFVDRSGDHILAYVSLPALLAGALWLSLLLRSGGSPRSRAGGIAAGVAVATLVTAVAWSSAGDRLDRSALAHALPGGNSLRGALDRLWHPPPISGLAPTGERLVRRRMPSSDRIYVLMAGDSGTEILLRAGRANEFPLAHPLEDSFISLDLVPLLSEELRSLHPGDRILVDDAGLRRLADPPGDEAEPLDQLELGRDLVGIQLWLLDRIAERFPISVVKRESDVAVVELGSRRPHP